MTNKIVVNLTANTGSFVTDVDRATKAVEKQLKRMEREAQRDLQNFGKWFAAGAAAAAAGLALMVRNAINTADELSKLSQKVGVTVEDLSRLAYAAKLGDVELADLQQALVKLADSATEAQDGTSNQAAAFQALGVSVKDAEGNLKPLNTLLLEVADATSRYADGAGKTAALTDIFGRSAANLIPLLNGGSQAIKGAGDELERFGGLISNETAQAANEFNGNLIRLKTASEALALQIAAELLPDLVNLTNQFIDFIKEGDGAARTVASIKDGFAIARPVFVSVANALQIIARSVRATAGALFALSQGDFKSAFGLLSEAREEGVKDWEQLTDAIYGTSDAVKSVGAALEGSGLTGLGGLIGFGSNNPQLNYDPEAQRKAAEAAKKAAAEARRIQEAIAQGGAEIFEAGQERERQALEASLEARAISYKGYLAERLRLTEQAIDQEIEAARALQVGAERDEQILLQARIEALEIRREIARDESAQDEARHVREIAQAYDEAEASARSYLGAITRQGERTLQDLQSTPAQRRFNAGQFQIDDRFIGQIEALDRELATGGVDQQAYEQRLRLLQSAHDAEISEWRDYFDQIETLSNDFNTSFNNSINEYLDATANVGRELGDTLVSALDQASAGIADTAAEFILFGEDGRAAIAALAREIATSLLSALIRVGIQALINKTLLSSFGGGFGGGASLIGAANVGGGFASGGYTGDDPRNSVTGIVHGQEFVVNADATRENRALLESINNGTFSNQTDAKRSSSPGGIQGKTPVRIINVPDKGYIKDYLMGSDGDEVFINLAGRHGSRLRSIVNNA